MIKWLLICKIENHNTSFSSSIECSTKWLKSFLSCGIPNLHCKLFCFSILFINTFNLLTMEICTDGRFISLWNTFSNEILNNWCFSDCTVTKHNDLDNVIFLRRICFSLCLGLVLHFIFFNIKNDIYYLSFNFVYYNFL